jgi:dihydroanticapsin dehydrogenase
MFGLVEDVSAEAWSDTFNVNVRGYALMAKHIVPLLKQQLSGSIIQFGSISGTIAQPAFIPCSTTKGAVIQMTRNLALDLGPYNIRCNTVSTGCIGMFFYELSIFIYFDYILETPPIQQAVASTNLTMEQFIESCTLRQCLKRIGRPQEIANLVVFLASDLCPFLTGANLLADGGYTAI